MGLKYFSYLCKLKAKNKRLMTRTMHLLHKVWPMALSLLFGAAVWLFWTVGYRQALSFHEQFQLFLFGGDYFSQCLSEPGGLARWLGELLTQFYNSFLLGGLVLALLLVAVQRLTWRLMSANTPSLYPLSFIPALLLWYAQGDYNVLLCYVVALVLALAVSWLLSRCGVLLSFIVALVAMPLLYWLIGPLALLSAVMLAVVVPLRRRQERRWPLLLVAGLLAVVAVWVSVVVSSHHLPYSLERLSWGLSYYRVPVFHPAVLIVIPAAALLLAMLSALPQKAFNHRHSLSVGLGSLVVVAGLGIVLVPKGFPKQTYDVMDYDYLVRAGQWQAIIAKSEQRQPSQPMSVAATNLALAMEGQLCERGFEFFQRGVQGLLPPFERNFASALLTGEIYFQLGLVNTAQRFAFESMESIPNYAKSVRTVRRLAETNMLNGQYEVALKYLNLLERTMFYKKWARQMKELLGQEDKINAHPLYGRLRQMRLTDDFLFSEREGDRIMGQLFVRNPQNRLAMQYLLMWPLLERDVNKFMNYLGVVHKHVGFNPRHVQEAAVYAYAQQNLQLPQGLTTEVLRQNFLNFANIFNRQGKDSPQLKPFEKTFWYYLVKGQ